MSVEGHKWKRQHRRALSSDDNFVPSSPSTPRINAGSDSTLSTPTSTPPKKAWERHYRSFLKKRGPGQNLEIPPPPAFPIPAVVIQDRQRSHSSGNSSGLSSETASGKGLFALVPGSKRLITRHSSEKDCSIPTELRVSLSKARSNSNGDVTVKGGSFFSQIFHKDGNHSANATPVQHARKIKSMNELDATVRRGKDKSYSPTNKRFVHSTDDLSHPSAPSLASSASYSTGVLLLPRSPQTEPADVLLPRSMLSPPKPQASTEIKKAFTEFHNSSAFAKDSTSAYLGEDSSVSGNNFFSQYNQTIQFQNAALSEGNIPMVRSAQILRTSMSTSLEPVTEGIILHKSERLLKQVTGPDSWNSGRRYLIAPAILATCPLSVLPTLFGTKHISTFDDSCFGILVLGPAMMKYTGQRKDRANWALCCLVLRQNYLLEYEDEDMKGIPRGFAHLQNARAYPHPDFHDALELEFFGSPCANSDKRRLLIRVQQATDRDRWITALNHAARMTMKDLYDFNEEDCLGSGRYATVYKARRRCASDSSPMCAIKVVDKSEFWRRVVKGMERADTLVREASVQATLSAKGDKVPSVVKLFSIFETSDNVVFEVELLEGTDLFNHISSKGLLDEEDAAKITSDILVSLDAMNRYGIAHRDIKPANILMADRERHGVYIKVADFGMSTFVGVDGKLRGRCGTPGYVAPEIFSAGVNGGYGNKVDVFSAGVTLYVMLCGYEPFYGETDAELIEANREAVLEFPETDWGTVSSDARDLVQAMLLPDPTERISAKDALKHPWIVNRTDVSTGEHVSISLHNSSEGVACVIS